MNDIIDFNLQDLTDTELFAEYNKCLSQQWYLKQLSTIPTYTYESTDTHNIIVDEMILSLRKYDRLLLNEIITRGS